MLTPPPLLLLFADVLTIVFATGCFILNCVSSHWFAVAVATSCTATTVLSTITTDPYAMVITSVYLLLLFQFCWLIAAFFWHHFFASTVANTTAGCVLPMLPQHLISIAVTTS